MKRDRIRSDIEIAFMALLGELSQDNFDISRLTAKSFAEVSGLSRQALHKSHSDVTNALSLLAKGLRAPVRCDDELVERVKSLQAELADVKAKRLEAVEQNHLLCTQVLQLQKRLKKTQFEVVPINGRADDAEE